MTLQASRAIALGKARTGGRGFTLIVSLIFLVLITVVAIASIRSVGLQSRMSAATLDRSLAYQSAEAGLREAEARASAATDAQFPASGCVGGYCANALPSEAARWASAANTGWLAATAPLTANEPVAQTLVERYGQGQNFPGCAQAVPPIANCLTPRYRVTSRAVRANGASVILQSDVATP